MRAEPGVIATPRSDQTVIARPRSGRGDLGEIGTVLNRWLGALKRICGMPDYPGYLHHMAEKHPGGPVLSERQFYDEQVQARYGNGASRCC